MVADRLAAEVELVGDLGGRASELEQAQDLGLARRQRELGMVVRLLDHVGDLAEDPDHVLALAQGHGADLDRHVVPLRVDDRDGCIGHVRVAE